VAIIVIVLIFNGFMATIEWTDISKADDRASTDDEVFQGLFLPESDIGDIDYFAIGMI